MGNYVTKDNSLSKFGASTRKKFPAERHDLLSGVTQNQARPSGFDCDVWTTDLKILATNAANPLGVRGNSGVTLSPIHRTVGILALNVPKASCDAMLSSVTSNCTGLRDQICSNEEPGLVSAAQLRRPDAREKCHALDVFNEQWDVFMPRLRCRERQRNAFQL